MLGGLGHVAVSALHDVITIATSLDVLARPAPPGLPSWSALFGAALRREPIDVWTHGEGEGIRTHLQITGDVITIAAPEVGPSPALRRAHAANLNAVMRRLSALLALARTGLRLAVAFLILGVGFGAGPLWDWTGSAFGLRG